MRTAITRLMMHAAIAAIAVFAVSTSAWATPACPTASPSFSPDFTGAASSNCLTLNGSANLPTPAGSAASIASWSGSGSTVTFQAANSFSSGEPVILSGFASSTFFNGLVLPVAAANGTSFQITFSSYSGGSDTGTATPVNLLQLTPASTSQAGSAWYNNQQPVANPFSTTFTFQLSGSTTLATYGNADGIAFVIQNSTAATAALGPDGCGMGFGNCESETGGIPNSLAVAFKTYNDGDSFDNENSVLITNNGTAANCISDANSCVVAYNNSLPNGITLADGNIHTATISYSLQPTSAQTNCGGLATPVACLDVILDGYDLFPAGVPFNISNVLTLNSGAAYVGLTGGTGGGDDNQDILSWTFTPQSQSQTGTVNPGAPQPTPYNFNGGFSEGSPTSGYTITAQETSNSNNQAAQVVVTPIPVIAPQGSYSSAAAASQAACNAIVQVNPTFNNPGSPAQCFVIQNGGGQGVDAPVMFEVTCPSSPNGCGSGSVQSFFATLGAYFSFTCTENPPLACPADPPNPPGASSFGLPNYTAFDNFATLPGDNLPEVGFLKGAGVDPNHPCSTQGLPPGQPLFQSNQILSFVLGDSSSKPSEAGSGGTASCWLVTYQTQNNEWPTINITTPPSPPATYTQGQTVDANYTCTPLTTVTGANPNPATGPYLTMASCTGPAASGSPINTSLAGTYTFTVQATDSAYNTNSQSVTYYVDAAVPSVVGSPLLTASSAISGVGLTVGTVTYQSSSTVLSGNVISQSPIAGTPDNGGTPVSLVISNGVAVPSVVGSTLSTAEAAIIGAGLTVGTLTYQSSSTVLSGNVISESPVAGTLVNGLTPVSLVVSTGVAVPNVVGQTQSTAEAAIIGAGLTVGTVTTAASTTVPAGSVISESPGAGTLVNGRTPVNLVVSNSSVTVTSSINFGTVKQGTITTQAITVTNTGLSIITMTEPFISIVKGQSDAFLILSWCPKSLQPGGKCEITVSFIAGPYYLPQTAYLYVMDNAPGNPQQVTLTATVVDPQASLSATSLSFGTQNPSSSPTTKTVTLKNTGGTLLSISKIALTSSSPFTITPSSAPCGSSLAAGSSCVIDVTFKPTGKASYSATLQVTDNSITGSTQSVALTGAGN